jgi:glycosyltransferase involved in cell wall biosynthesis
LSDFCNYDDEMKKMKICVFGQCQGGNAKLWFDLFENEVKQNQSIEDLTYICRNSNDFTSKNFKIINLYGLNKGNKFIKKIRTKIVSSFYFDYFITRFFQKNSFDILHIQGNYSPELNLKLIKYFKGKVVLHIYGSDFYQNILNEKSSKNSRMLFEKVLNSVDQILVNRNTTKEDVSNVFPFFKEKIVAHRMGASDDWKFLNVKKTKEKIFLSTRGLYAYNNVDLLVEAFAMVFKGRENYKLYILNGYGNDQNSVDRVFQLIKQYDIESQVITKINYWVSDEELLDLYKKSDFNFCIGSSDQLSISITYGYLSKTTNILSPLLNYKELTEKGYHSHYTLPEISLNALVNFFNTNMEVDNSLLETDYQLANEDGIFSENFKNYIIMYKNLLNN